MTNREVVTAFLASYQRHDCEGMYDCLDPEVEFRDLAFERITGAEVRAMWRWFCQATKTRKEPIDVPGFEIVKSEGDRVLAEYWVRYSPKPGRIVNYVIRSEFVLRGGKIVRQIDEPAISNLELARMAKGFPACLVALLTPVFKWRLRKTMLEQLGEFTKPSRAKAAATS